MASRKKLMAAKLSMDIIYTILTQRPVKPLLRLRCVCKAWRNLIDSSDFIKFHLNRSLESNFIHCLVYIQRCDNFLYQLYELNTFSKTKVKKFPGIKVPSIVGTCNGLICISSNRCDLVLYNPSTRSFRHLRKPKEIKYKCFGFGYDCQGDDYKIVGLFDEKVVVYSLRDDRWRSEVGGKETIGEYPGHLVCNDHGLLANNCLHWIQCDDQNCNHVIVFDIDHEKWSKLPLPNKMDEFFSRLGSFDSCLSLYRVRSDSTNEGMIKHEVWIMKEYGVKESWIKLFSFEGKGEMPLTYYKGRSEVIFSRYPRYCDMDHTGFFRGKVQQGGMDNVELVHEVHQHHKFVTPTLCIESLTPVA